MQFERDAAPTCPRQVRGARPPHRRRVLLLAAIGGSLALTGGPSAAAASATAAPPPTISISGVTAGETLSGAVQVTATLSGSSSADPATTFEFALYGGGHITEDLPVPATGCADGCSVQWNLDTDLGAPGVAGVPGAADLLDGPADLQVVALDAHNRQVGWQDVSLTVDNHRPTVTTDPAPPSGWAVVSGNDQVVVHARATTAADAPAGTGIADVMLEIPGLGTGTVVRLTQSPSDPSSWTGRLDTSQVPAGYYQAQLVAVDSNGRVSGWGFTTEVHIEVDHGFTLGPDGTSAVSTDPRQLRVAFTYPQWARAVAPFDTPRCYPSDGYADVQQEQVSLDGKAWYSGSVSPGQLGQIITGNGCLLQVVPNGSAAPGPLPAGHHVLSFQVTDSDGVVEHLDEPVLVGGRPLTVTWPRGGYTAVAGSTVHLSPAIAAPDGFSRIQSWAYTFEGRTIVSGTSAQAPTLTWKMPGNLVFTQGLRLTVVTDSGQSTVSSVPLRTAYQTATTVSASARQVRRGGWVTVNARVWFKYEGRWQALGPNLYSLRLQWAPPGSTAWRTIAYRNVDLPEKPPVSFRTRVWKPGCYRVVSSFPAGAQEPFFPSTSAAVCVKL